MKDFLMNSLGSVFVGIALWALLPRGVVLTRRRRLRNHREEPMLGTWELRNNSSIPIRIESVLVAGPAAPGRGSGRQPGNKLILGQEPEGVSLAFDDGGLDTLLHATRSTWKGVTIPPGDTLQAAVGAMWCLQVKYRRKGWCGLLERRQIVVNGGI